MCVTLIHSRVIHSDNYVVIAMDLLQYLSIYSILLFILSKNKPNFLNGMETSYRKSEQVVAFHVACSMNLVKREKHAIQHLFYGAYQCWQ